MHCSLETPQPFVEEGHAIHSYFPRREFAVAVPTVLLVLLIVIAATFIALLMICTTTSEPATPPRKPTPSGEGSGAAHNTKVE